MHVHLVREYAEKLLMGQRQRTTGDRDFRHRFSTYDESRDLIAYAHTHRSRETAVLQIFMNVGDDLVMRERRSSPPFAGEPAQRLHIRLGATDQRSVKSSIQTLARTTHTIKILKTHREKILRKKMKLFELFMKQSCKITLQCGYTPKVLRERRLYVFASLLDTRRRYLSIAKYRIFPSSSTLKLFFRLVQIYGSARMQSGDSAREFVYSLVQYSQTLDLIVLDASLLWHKDAHALRSGTDIVLRDRLSSEHKDIWQ